MNLYLRRTVTASAVLLVVISIFSVAAAQQRRKAHKLRATGLLELTTNQGGTVTARLIPITILDQGKFEDASIYKAAPRPMAIDNGVVYEAQKSGVPVGYVTINNASNVGMWTALGKWQPATTEEARKSDQSPAPAPSTDEDRPRLHRGDSGTASATATPTPPPASQATPEPTPEPEPEDSDRPVLRRRTPAKPAPQPETTPAVAPPPASTQSAVPAPRVQTNKPGTQEFVAVSDAAPTDTRSFEYVFKPEDRGKMEEQMRKLALAQLPRENAQLNEGSMTNVVIRAFDVDMSNEAVIVLTAEIPGSYVAPGVKGAPGKFVSRFITLIARTDYEGVPQRLAVSITDSSRLDVAPRLELIDAVDVDGDGLAELLFREYSFDQNGFIVYGVGRGTVTKVFEGATSPLP